jgi:O-antigen/teichoic acid export membrane protein
MANRKYYTDTAWNFGSFGVQALAGVALNLLLMRHAGPGALGIFNQLYAIFVITGQLAVCGFQDSAQKHVSEYDSQELEKRTLITAGLANTFLAGFAGTLVLGIIGILMPGNLGQGVLLLAPGVQFFVLNKVLLAVFNGERRMRLYAAGQALRALLVVGGCLLVGLKGWNGAFMGLAFALSELVLFLALLPFVAPHLKEFAPLGPWMKRHLHFGAKALPHGFLTETMVRVDVLALSFFLDEAQIGIYSFVAFFLEGILQVPLNVRTVTNPIWTGIIIRRSRKEFFATARRAILTSGLSTLVVIAVLMACFPSFIADFPKTDPVVSWRLLKILMAGLAVYAFFLPLDHLLLQGGKPGWQSIAMVIATTLNLGLNFILIPSIGLAGAALATAIAFAASGPILCVMAYFTLAFSHWPKHAREA